MLALFVNISEVNRQAIYWHSLGRPKYIAIYRIHSAGVQHFITMHCWIIFDGYHPAGISHKKLLEQYCVHIVQYSMYFDALCGVLMWYVCFKYVVLLRFVAIYAVMLWRHDFAQYPLSQAFLRVFPGHFYRCCMYCCYILSRRIQVSFPRICAIFPSNFDVLRAFYIISKILANFWLPCTLNACLHDAYIRDAYSYGQLSMILGLDTFGAGDSLIHDLLIGWRLVGNWSARNRLVILI